MQQKANGSADMTDTPMVQAVASPLESMVRESSPTRGERSDAHPVQKIESISMLPWRCRSLTILEQTMAMRKREEEVVFPNAAAIDVGA